MSKIRSLAELDQLPDDALINEPEARSYYGISRTTFWRGWGSIYPAPRKFGYANRWLLGEIRKSVRGQAA